MNNQYNNNHADMDANRDPITGEPGSHPVGTGVGATAAGAVGAVAGAAVAGPVGAVAGAAIGASLGGMAGHAVGEKVNPTYAQVEPDLQRDFSSRSYAKGQTFDQYKPAYEYGSQSYAKYGRTQDGQRREWDDRLEAELQQGWSNTKASVNMGFDKAKGAVRDAWHATERAIPGDFDRDGR